MDWTIKAGERSQAVVCVSVAMELNMCAHAILSVLVAALGPGRAAGSRVPG